LFFVLAKRDTNPQLCYGISFHEPTLIADPINSRWVAEQRDEAYCSFELWSEYEFHRVKTPQTSEFCINLSSTIDNQRDQCLQLAASNEQNPFICLESSNQEMISDCLGDDTALDPESWLINDISEYEQLTKNIVDDWGPSWRAKCLTMLAHQKKEVKFCDSIADLSWRDSWGWWGNWFQCVRGIAENEGNPNLCDHITKFEPPSNYPRRIFSAEGCRVKVKTGKIPIQNILR